MGREVVDAGFVDHTPDLDGPPVPREVDDLFPDLKCCLALEDARPVEACAAVRHEFTLERNPREQVSADSEVRQHERRDPVRRV
jgi:hypothetical protein